MRDRTGALSSNESSGRDGDSDPNADELLRRACNPRSALSPRGRAALERLESNAIRLRDAEAWDAPVRQGLAEYREWADGVAA